MAELSKEECQKIALECHADPVAFCKVFLPHLFSGPIPWFHRGALAILTGKTKFLHKYGDLDKILSNFVVTKDPLDPKSEVVDSLFYVHEGQIRLSKRQFVLLMWPRGFAKTTIAGIAMPLYKILYQELPFLVYVSHALTHSRLQLDNVKRELERNEAILAVFGELKPQLRDGEAWTKDLFETTSGIAFAARSVGGQIRGLNIHGNRPTEFIVDDLEDFESANSETQRAKLITWAYSDLLPALPKLRDDARMIALGTMLHKYDVLSVWARDRERWATVKFGARDRQGDLLWPANMDDEKLEKEKLSFANAGRLTNYYLEYFNESRRDETKIFHIDKIQVSPPEGELQYAVYMDPAFSEKRTADYSCIATVGMSDKGIMWVVDCWLERTADHNKLMDEYFRQAITHNVRIGGIEGIAAQAALVSLVREQMFRRHYYFELINVQNKTRKVERIRGALPARYHTGHLRHAEVYPLLMTQLDEFQADDSHEHDDGPDAVAGAVILLDPYAAMAAGEDLTVDEYEPLDKVLNSKVFAY